MHLYKAHDTSHSHPLSSPNFALRHIRVLMNVPIKQADKVGVKVLHYLTSVPHWIRVGVSLELLLWFPFYAIQCAVYKETFPNFDTFFFSSQVSVFTTITVKHWEHWAGNSTVIVSPHVVFSRSLLQEGRDCDDITAEEIYVKGGGRRQHEPGNPKSQSSRRESQNLGDFRAKILPLGDFRKLDCRGQCGMRK